eukprot:2768867-Amphidinium_carterae.1
MQMWPARGYAMGMAMQLATARSNMEKGSRATSETGTHFEGHALALIVVFGTGIVVNWSFCECAWDYYCKAQQSKEWAISWRRL